MSAPSARGLFRAMGKTSKPTAIETGHDLGGTFERPVYRERIADGFEPTPPAATLAFIEAEGARIRERFSTIWECAAGDGAMVRLLNAAGFTVIASDLVDRGCGAEMRSFYDYAVAPAACAITNPPYHESSWGNGARARWIVHGLDALGLEYFALLMPASWAAAAGLGPLWARRPPARVYLLRFRIDFTGQGSNPSNHAWFVWERGVTDPRETRYLMLDRCDAGQASLFGSAGA